MARTQIKSTDITPGAANTNLNASELSFDDGVKAKFGDSNDLQMYHDGSNSYIKDTGTGNFVLEGSSQLKLTGPAGDYFMGQNNGSAYVYHAGNLKAYTTAAGLYVNGTVTATSFVGDGSSLTGIDSLPSQTGNTGKYLTTDGSTASWASVSGGSTGIFPFFKADGTQDNIALTAGSLPFFKANGTQDNIGVI